MISNKTRSAIIITAGTLSGYLIARSMGEDKTVGLMLGTLAGKLADDIINEPEEVQTLTEEN